MEDKEYGRFWIRFGALLIDLVAITIVLCIPLSLIYGEEYWFNDQIIYGFWATAPFLATIWFWLRYLGTPGKMTTKLEIVNAISAPLLALGLFG